MSPRQQPRRIARELALLSLSQIKGNPENLEQQALNDLILVAVRTLTLTQLRKPQKADSAQKDQLLLNQFLVSLLRQRQLHLTLYEPNHLPA